MTTALLMATFHFGDAHQGFAMLFVTAAVGVALASFVIEPTTTRAAFGAERYRSET